jgi:hypothetical protein
MTRTVFHAFFSWTAPPVYFRFYNYRHSMCFRASSVFVLSILFWFPQRTHYFWRVFRFLFMEHKQDYSVTKTIGKKEKKIFKIFASTKIIDFNHTCKIKHVWKSVPLGLHNTEITLSVFRFLFMEHKQDYSVTSVKDVKVCF